MGGRATLALLGVLTAIVARAGGESPAAAGVDEPASLTGRPITAFFYQCDDGSSVVAKLEDDGRENWLFRLV